MKAIGIVRAAARWALSALVVAAATACSGRSSSAPDPGSDPELRLGREVWTANCAGCHGGDGRGGIGPRLAGRVAEKYPDPAEQEAVVRKGRGSMPAWEGALTDEQIAAVVRYTREVL